MTREDQPGGMRIIRPTGKRVANNIDNLLGLYNSTRRTGFLRTSGAAPEGLKNRPAHRNGLPLSAGIPLALPRTSARPRSGSGNTAAPVAPPRSPRHRSDGAREAVGSAVAHKYRIRSTNGMPTAAAFPPPAVTRRVTSPRRRTPAAMRRDVRASPRPRPPARHPVPSGRRAASVTAQPLRPGPLAIAHQAVSPGAAYRLRRAVVTASRTSMGRSRSV